MKKIIFLDFDGVLNTKWWYTQMDRNTPKDKYGYAFDPKAVANLKRIVVETGADIGGLPGKLIGVTPNPVSDEMLLDADIDSIELFHIRGEEIKEWLTRHGRHVSHYVIIDDMDNMLPEQQSVFVQTNPEVGLTEDDANKAIVILNKK